MKYAILIWFFTISIIFALLLDSYGSPETTKKFLGISSIHLMYLFWMISPVFMHKKINYKSMPHYQPILAIITGVFGFATLVLSIWDFVTPDNAVFSATRIKQESLAMIPLFTGIMLLLVQPYSWWKKHYQRIMVLTPFVLTACLAVVRMWPMNYFLEIVKEDHLIENFQVYVLIASTAVIVYLWRTTHIRLNIFTKLLLGLIVFILIFLAGEEIAWGQRILGLQTPDILMEHNRQEEITLHNLYSVEWMVEVAYVIIGLLGSTLWIFKRFFRLPWIINLFIPAWYLFGFFLLPAIHFLYPIYWGVNKVREWAEVKELLLYGGIGIHAVHMTYYLTRTQDSSNSMAKSKK